MTTELEMQKFFDDQFFYWDKNRMYPLNYRSNSMISIDEPHLRAVARSMHFVRSGITKNMTPKLISSIELDLKLLNEVYDYCRQQINEPGLPMSPESKGQGNNGEKDGQSS